MNALCHFAITFIPLACNSPATPFVSANYSRFLKNSATVYPFLFIKRFELDCVWHDFPELVWDGAVWSDLKCFILAHMLLPGIGIIWSLKIYQNELISSWFVANIFWPCHGAAEPVWRRVAQAEDCGGISTAHTCQLQFQHGETQPPQIQLQIQRVLRQSLRTFVY